MKIYRLTINHPAGNSYTYHFSGRPQLLTYEYGVFCHEGERIKLYKRTRGLREEVVKIETLGTGQVYASARNVVSWFVEPMEVEVKEQE